MNTKSIRANRAVHLSQFVGLVLVMALYSGATSIATAQTAPLSKDDTAFLKDAYQGGLFEIEVGKYAATNGNADVAKQFGQHMVTDHTGLNQKLADLAQKNGLTLDTEASTATSVKIKTASTLSGTAFDKTYLPLMVHDHKSDIKAFQKEASTTSNADIKSAIQDALPTLRAHLKMAQQAETTVSSSK